MDAAPRIPAGVRIDAIVGADAAGRYADGAKVFEGSPPPTIAWSS